MGENRHAIRDIYCILQLNFKLVFHKKLILLVFGMSGFIFLIISRTLFSSADERSSIPIALVDQDKSSMSKQLIQELKETEAVYVYETSTVEAENMLTKQLIQVWFELKPEMQENIQKGDTKALIVVHYLKENKGITILSDIVAGKLMYPICLNKTLKVYKNLSTNSKALSEQNYRQFISKLAKNNLFEFRFQIDYVSGQEKTEHKNIKNNLLYQQAVIGIVGFFFSFIIMFLIYSLIAGYESVWKSRLFISGISKVTFYASQFITASIIMSVLSAVYIVLIAILIPNYSAIRLIQLYGVFFLFCMEIIILFIVIGVVLRKTTAYQLFGSFLILGFGTLGTGGFILADQSQKVINILKIIPNYWFIKEFTDIIIDGAI